MTSSAGAQTDVLPAQSEASFQKAVVELAKVLRWRVYHTWLSYGSAAGFPDLVLVKPPRVILAEMKRENGKLSRKQQEWLDVLRACPGVETYVWRPSDWNELVRVLHG